MRDSWSRGRRLDNLGGHSGGDPPLPIPNREVKPASADGTRGASPRESRTPPILSRGETMFPPLRPFPCAATDRPRLGSRRAEARLRPQACAFPSTYTRSHGAPRRRSRLASVDRGRRRRDGRGLQRPRCRALDPDDPASVHGGATRSRSFDGRCCLTTRRWRSSSTGASSAGSASASTRTSTARPSGTGLPRRPRGRGICTRALRLLSRHALEELELQRVDLITDPDNVASQRVAEKVGFRREGVLRAHLRHPDGRIRDSVMFSLLPGELA